jgi:AAA ATPase domain
MGTLAPVARICGREAEIQALGEALDRVAAGGPAIVLVEGEAGIGKTRLLGQVLEHAADRGMLVAAGQAEELEATRPFGVLAAAFGCTRSAADPRRAAIAGLLAAPGAGEQGPITVTSDPGLRFRVVDAFTDLVEELALAGPVVLGLDDLQWADPSSLLTVGALARRLTGLPVGVIGCLRPSPRTAERDLLAPALEAAGARHLTLYPLTREAVTGLVAQAVAAEPGPRLLEEMAGAAGNPLFITELLGALAQEGAITTAGGRAEVAQTVLPPTLRLTILRRVSFLPEPTLQGQQPHVGRAARRRRGDLSLAARPRCGSIPGRCGPGKTRARSAGGRPGARWPLRAGAGVRVTLADRFRAGRCPGVGPTGPAVAPRSVLGADRHDADRGADGVAVQGGAVRRRGGPAAQRPGPASMAGAAAALRPHQAVCDD